MRKVVIDMDLSRESIRAGVKQLREFKKWLTTKEHELLVRLGEEGFQEARVMFNYAMVFYNNGQGGVDADITVEERRNRYTIRAHGQDVCFIEFGAGITYGKGYPAPRPDGIVGIGEYGKKHGKWRNGWWYKDASGTAVRTLGNPPAAGMYGATQAIRQKVYQIAVEVFG